MSFEEFKKGPAKKTHTSYRDSFLHMRPAPEFASGEVVLASTYRSVGSTISESKVPTLGREFSKKIAKDNRSHTPGRIDSDSWQGLITGTLRSPKQPNQSSKRFLQISPVVPDATIYSLSARLTTNSWNPGELVSRIIQFSKSSQHDSQSLWDKLFYSLCVDDNDDIWARFLQQEFEQWRGVEASESWKEPTQIKEVDAINEWRASPIDIPATQFSLDLEHVISLKSHLTRRQWVSMLESIIRLGSASHILWLCNANMVCFDLIKDALFGKPVPDIDVIKKKISVGEGYWRLGQYSSGTISQYSIGYIKARFGINLILYQLEKDFKATFNANCMSNLTEITKFLNWIASDSIRNNFDKASFENDYIEVIESDERLIAGKKGITANIAEFIRHSLGQRQTGEPGLDSYDQGYFLAKRGRSKSARWEVSLGPVSILTLVHVCTHDAKGPRTIDNLCDHLSKYGIDLKAQDVATSKLGTTLRNLGLVLDSPDAEGGMVLINPFELMVE